MPLTFVATSDTVPTDTEASASLLSDAHKTARPKVMMITQSPQLIRKEGICNFEIRWLKLVIVIYLFCVSMHIAIVTLRGHITRYESSRKFERDRFKTVV